MFPWFRPRKRENRKEFDTSYSVQEAEDGRERERNSIEDDKIFVDLIGDLLSSNDARFFGQIFGQPRHHIIFDFI